METTEDNAAASWALTRIDGEADFAVWLRAPRYTALRAALGVNGAVKRFPRKPFMPSARHERVACIEACASPRRHSDPPSLFRNLQRFRHRRNSVAAQSHGSSTLGYQDRTPRHAATHNGGEIRNAPR